VTIVFVNACEVVADWAVIGVSTNGGGAPELRAFIAPPVGWWSSPAMWPGAHVCIAGHRGHVPRYSERTLIPVSDATTAFSTPGLGAALATTGIPQWRPSIALAIVLQLMDALWDLSLRAS
jgi:hypothetical protein